MIAWPAYAQRRGHGGGGFHGGGGPGSTAVAEAGTVAPGSGGSWHGGGWWWWRLARRILPQPDTGDTRVRMGMGFRWGVGISFGWGGYWPGYSCSYGYACLAAPYYPYCLRCATPYWSSARSNPGSRAQQRHLAAPIRLRLRTEVTRWFCRTLFIGRRLPCDPK